MKFKLLFLLLIVLGTTTVIAQTSVTNSSNYQNNADLILQSDSKLSIGGYGEVHYNQPIEANKTKLGTLDLHRVIMFMGYNFNEKTQFVTEIEFEHTNELWVEQAFLQHKINQFINFRAGLMLIPMGIINEYHEPTTFYSVERPTIDSKIAPSTWREIGAGFAGNIIDLNLKYQAYVVGGLNGYDSKGVFNGSKGLRSGRQKGAKAYVSSPNFTGRIEYYGIRNLNVGVSGYFGDSQSKLYNGIDKNDATDMAVADSSVVGISMIGVDFRYQLEALHVRSQFYLTSLSNTEQYNTFTAVDGNLNDLGSEMMGYYLEAGYNVFSFSEKIDTELIPFVRYEHYNTHYAVDGITDFNGEYNNHIITMGLNYKLTNNSVLKADFQLVKNDLSDKYSQTVNAGFGIRF